MNNNQSKKRIKTKLSLTQLFKLAKIIGSRIAIKAKRIIIKDSMATSNMAIITIKDSTAFKIKRISRNILLYTDKTQGKGIHPHPTHLVAVLLQVVAHKNRKDKGVDKISTNNIINIKMMQRIEIIQKSMIIKKKNMAEEITNRNPTIIIGILLRTGVNSTNIKSNTIKICFRTKDTV
jgi:hypothetical protein